jgi:tetratricopeptide (TPR) repeat protein
MNEIGRQLGVAKVLEGGVQRAGDRVRINVQLIDAATSAHLWAESYDRELTIANIFAIQSEVAAAIVGALKASLTPGEQARAKLVPTQNLEAWEAYQLGKQRMAARSTPALADAETHLQNAITLDPKFPLAYVGLADTLRLQTIYGGAPMNATLTRAESAASTALNLDPTLAEGWTSTAGVAFSRGQYDRAERMFLKAIELNPNYATAHHWYSGMLSGLGRMDEALASAEKARALDPLSAIINFNLGGTLESVGRFEEADFYYRKVIAIDPHNSGSYGMLGTLDAYGLSRFAEAVPLLRKAVELDPGDILTAVMLVLVLSDLGDVSEASQISDDVLKRWPDDVYANASAAIVHLSRGNKDSAVRYAQKSLELDPQQLSGDGRSLAMLTYADLEKGDYVTARARYAKAGPQLLSAKPQIERVNYRYAIDLATILKKTGETERAKLLLDRSEQIIRTMSRVGMSGYGIDDVRIEALRGARAKALIGLREAAKAGWRGPFWRYYRDFDPALFSIRNDPEFKAIFADIERDMAQQRARLAARPKDVPLELTDASR